MAPQKMYPKAPALRLIRVLAAATLAGACGASIGATKTANFNVTASVSSNCFINSASTLAFGAYAATTGDVDQTSTISVRCSTGTPYGIGLSAGTGTGSTLAQRVMTSATATGSALQFNLYTDATRLVVWNDPSTAGATPGNQGGLGAGLGIPNSISHTVYGRLQDSATSQAAAPASDYTSTITVTINY